ncbi:IclR family transcriptional regulator [Paracoccus aminophilus]|nr:IclR family transcriptional regulator [Paracoccus aminophilus]
MSDLPATTTESPAKTTGAQTLLRGLALLELVAEGESSVKALAARLGVPRSTAARMLAALVADGYLYNVPYRGYFLGPKLVHLGDRARAQRPLVSLARPILDELAATSRDTVHLGVLDGAEVLYLDKLPGLRGLEMRSHIGKRMPVATTGLGKAIMLALPESRWPALYAAAVEAAAERPESPPVRAFADLAADLRACVARGWASDLEENEYGIRCVSAPLRDAGGAVAGAISVSSALNFMPEDRMRALGPVVRQAADAISNALGWASTPDCEGPK